MKKNNVVKKNIDFDNIIANGHFVKNKEFIIYNEINNLNKYRFGISVGKKIGNAVTRNYYKRIIRKIVDDNKKCYQNSKDYIIIIRKAATLLNYQEISNSLVSLLNKIEKEH